MEKARLYIVTRDHEREAVVTDGKGKAKPLAWDADGKETREYFIALFNGYGAETKVVCEGYWTDEKKFFADCTDVELLAEAQSN